jgi:hypothetical protein
MALIGGGGAPNVSGGANPAGTGSGLNYIGNHCYAYSGLIPIADSLTTCLEFTTGNSYAVAELTLCGGAKHDGGTNVGCNTVFEIYLDGTRNLLVKIESINETMPAMEVIPILIPPYTNFKVAFVSDASTANMFNSVSLTGRVYA